eukprot:SAG11_NODE_11171_length_779_cov_1.019118_1_plen_213_part_10
MKIYTTFARTWTQGLLLYPYTQIVFGTMRVASSPAYFPMRLHLLKFLVHVASKSDLYVPISTYVLEIFDAAELQASGSSKGATTNPPPIEHVLHVSKQVVSSRMYQARVVSTALSVLMQSFALLSYSVAFPELAFPAETRLRKFAKETRVAQFRKQAQTAVTQLAKNSAWVAEKRDGAEFSPKDCTNLKQYAGGGESPLALYISQHSAILKAK